MRSGLPRRRLPPLSRPPFLSSAGLRRAVPSRSAAPGGARRLSFPVAARPFVPRATGRAVTWPAGHGAPVAPWGRAGCCCSLGESRVAAELPTCVSAERGCACCQVLLRRKFPFLRKCPWADVVVMLWPGLYQSVVFFLLLLFFLFCFLFSCIFFSPLALQVLPLSWGGNVSAGSRLLSLDSGGSPCCCGSLRLQLRLRRNSELMGLQHGPAALLGAAGLSLLDSCWWERIGIGLGNLRYWMPPAHRFR